MVNDAIKRHWNVAAACNQIRRIFFENGAGSIGRRAPSKGPLAGDHFVEHGAKTENIGATICFCPRTCSGDMYPAAAEHHARPGKWLDGR